MLVMPDGADVEIRRLWHTDGTRHSVVQGPVLAHRPGRVGAACGLSGRPERCAPTR